MKRPVPLLCAFLFAAVIGLFGLPAVPGPVTIGLVDGVPAILAPAGA